jgi:hypothetical protein
MTDATLCAHCHTTLEDRTAPVPPFFSVVALDPDSFNGAGRHPTYPVTINATAVTTIVGSTIVVGRTRYPTTHSYDELCIRVADVLRRTASAKSLSRAGTAR